MKPSYQPSTMSRSEADVQQGAVVLDFGNDWCGYCMASAPLVEKALVKHAGVRHIRVADGRGLALGRSYRVKLWPTLILLRNGVEQQRLVRPTEPGEIEVALAELAK